MRLATEGTHARDTREKAPVFIPCVLTQEAAPSPLSFGAADFRDFIYQKPAFDRGFISATRKRTRIHDRYVNFRIARVVTIVAFGMHTLRFLSRFDEVNRS